MSVGDRKNAPVSACADCGRKVMVRMRGKVCRPPDENHDLCLRCWRVELDKARAAKLARD